MYTLDDLNYLYQDLEPFVDTHTMGLHYQKHAKGYLEHLNRLLMENNFDFSISLEELAQNIHDYQFGNMEDILFYLGGVLNHNLYFQSMSPNPHEMDELLKKDLVEKYGSYPAFVENFINTALKLKGSGYTFLELTEDGDLAIKNYENQDNPTFYGKTPLLNVDLWEHAYYLNYKNNKEEYLTNFFDIIDFSHTNQVYRNKKMIHE